MLHFELVDPQFGVPDLEFELRFADALVQLRFLLGLQLQLVLPLFAAALIFGLGGREIRFVLVLGGDFLDAGRKCAGDVADHLATELQGDERRAEPARCTALELRDGIRDLRREVDPFADPRHHLRRGQRLLLLLFLRVHQLLELSVQVLDLRLDALALERQLRQGLLDLFHLRLPDVADGVEERGLVRGLQRRERLGVLSLESAQRHRPEAANLLGEPHRAIQQETEPVVRRRRIEARDHAAEIGAGGRGAHEQTRIDGRLEQRELPDDALDVHAVADLEQPIADGVPVPCRAAGLAECRSTAWPCRALRRRRRDRAGR